MISPAGIRATRRSAASTAAAPTLTFGLLAAVHAPGALFFTYLMFFATGLPAQESARS